MGSLFVAGRGFLYRTDPRAKVIAMLLFTVWCFLPHPLWYGAVALALLFILSLYSTGRSYTRRIFFSVFPMLLFMLIFSPFAQRSGEPLLVIKGFKLLTKEGVAHTLLLMSRFLSITYLCALLLATTRMHDLMSALLFFRLSYRGALVISLAFTYIPFVADSFRRIEESHRIRVTEGGKKRRLADMVPTLTSALVVSLKSIPFLAMSLEQRGYHPDTKRSRYHDLSSYRHPVGNTVCVCLLFVLAVLL